MYKKLLKYIILAALLPISLGAVPFVKESYIYADPPLEWCQEGCKSASSYVPGWDLCFEVACEDNELPRPYGRGI